MNGGRVRQQQKVTAVTLNPQRSRINRQNTLWQAVGSWQTAHSGLAEVTVVAIDFGGRTNGGRFFLMFQRSAMVLDSGGLLVNETAACRKAERRAIQFLSGVWESRRSKVAFFKTATEQPLLISFDGHL